jgi:hypothetical protein
MEGPVNDGFTLEKREINFSITGPSSGVFTVVCIYIHSVENTSSRVSGLLYCLLQ